MALDLLWNVNPVVLMCGRKFVCLLVFSMSVGSLCDWREGRKDAGWSGHSWFRGRSKQGCWLLVKRALAL